MGTNAIASRMLALVLAFFLATMVVSVRGFAGPNDPSDPQPAPIGSTPPTPNYTSPEPLVPPANAIIPAPGPTAYLSGGGSVTPTGDYEYTLSLATPMGRAGMQPSLALSYSSRRPDHVAGLGWSIAGLSVIHRCPKSFFVDGAADGVDLDDTDALCLDGKKLTPISSGEYRTEREEFLRIVGRMHENFTVYRKDGTIAEYLPDGSGIAWPIASVHDRAGNEIRYKYNKKPPHSIKRIEYTTRFGDSTAGAYRIDFKYKPRSVALQAHVAGVATKQGDRLDTISVAGPNGPAWTYTFGYIRSPVTSRLLLETVQLCAYGTCTQKRVFEYEQAFPTWQRKQELSTDSTFAGSSVQVLDFDGDGRDDILITDPKKAKFQVWRNQSLGSTDDNPPSPIFQYVNPFSSYGIRPIPVDVDRDSAVEFVGFDDDNGLWRLYRWNPQAEDFVEDTTFPLVELSNMPWGPPGFDRQKVRSRERPYFVDLNGDGLPEMVKLVHKQKVQCLNCEWIPYTRVWPNNGGVFDPPTDHANDFFPSADSLKSLPPSDLVNYPAELEVRVEDRFGNHRQALIQRTYLPTDPDTLGWVEDEKMLAQKDSGTLEVKDVQAPKTKSEVGPSTTIPYASIDLDGDGLRDRLYFHEDSETQTDNVVAWTETNTGAAPPQSN